MKAHDATAKKLQKTIIVYEESAKAGKLRYDKSFEARLIQSDDNTKHWYTLIKNKLMSYRTCKTRISWRRETFKAMKEVVAMLVYRGNTLCVFLPLTYEAYVDNIDVEKTDLPTYKDTPVFVRLRNEKRVRLALDLIDQVMMERNIPHSLHHVPLDYYVPYEGLVDLIEKKLIKREVRSAEDEAIFEQDKKAE